VGESFLVFNLIQTFNTKQLVHMIAKGLAKGNEQTRKKVECWIKEMKHYFYFPNILLQCTNSVYCFLFEGNTKKHFAEFAGRMFVCRQFNTG
jgi:hypothetical protein